MPRSKTTGLLLYILFAFACVAAGPIARADTCTLSAENVTYYLFQSDNVVFTLNATVTSMMYSPSLSYSVTAEPTYHDINNHVVSSAYTDEVASGGSSSFAFNLNFNSNVNPRADIAVNKPAGAVRYTYTYHIHAQVIDNGIVAASSDWRDTTSSSSFTI